MPSRMEKYYNAEKEAKSRAARNEELYQTIYDEAEYTNVEGISIIEKNENIDIEKIRELIGVDKEKKRFKPLPPKVEVPIYEEEDKNYDIREILENAKNERPESNRKLSNTQFDILKSINFDENFHEDKAVDENELKNMIEAITVNSKIGQTGDLLDDLKSISDSNLTREIKEKIEDKKDDYLKDMDKSFFTSSLDLNSEDFEDLKDINKRVKANNKLTKVILFILLVILIAGMAVFVYNFILK